MTNEQLDTFMRYAKYSESIVWELETEVVSFLVDLGVLAYIKKRGSKFGPQYVRPTLAGKDLYNTQKSLLALTDSILQGL